MTPLNFLYVLIWDLSSVLGQILFKHALDREHSRNKAIQVMGAGIAAKTVEFFMWIGLLSKFDLSYIYPFEGLSRVLLVLGAGIFLKEKASPTLWVGVLLITAGVAIVSQT